MADSLSERDFAPIPPDFVSITIVTYNSGRFIKRCLESVLEQRYEAKEIIVIDNASTDGTIDILDQFADRCTIILNEENIGFAAAQNQAIQLTQGNWVLTLNPDVLLLPDFIDSLVSAGNMNPEVGTVCGKLLAIRATFDFHEKPLVDSTGIYFTPMLRHLDRGSQEVDNGHFTKIEYVFGATAAAALYRAEMIRDIAVDGEFFDHDFFVYREDADVAWRSQLAGWKCLYTPMARGYHVRNVLPGNRRALPAEINMHSVKNRYLMRIKNISMPMYRRFFWSILWRDLVVIGCCVLWEHSSLKAFWFLTRNWSNSMKKRKQVMSRKRVSDRYIESWFSYNPMSKQAPAEFDPRASVTHPEAAHF